MSRTPAWIFAEGLPCISNSGKAASKHPAATIWAEQEFGKPACGQRRSKENEQDVNEDLDPTPHLQKAISEKAAAAIIAVRIALVPPTKGVR